MPTHNSRGSSRAETNSIDPSADRYQRKLQRILRQRESGESRLSGGVGTIEPRMSDQMKEAILSPSLVGVTAPDDEGPLFQCTQCDMIVKESDPYCPFCGAIFADSPLAHEEVQETEDGPAVERPMIEKPIAREPIVRPERFDIFSLIGHKPRSKELLYHEALKGFVGSARLLEEIEHIISDVSALGTDTSKARRLMGSAWEAARDGNWNLVSAIARQTEEAVAPSIPDLVRSEIAKARKLLMEAKAAGVDISPYILSIKNIMQALHADEVDEALRLTKELMDSVREDAVSWR